MNDLKRELCNYLIKNNMVKEYDGEKCTQGFQMWSADFNKILDILKEVSE